MMLLGAILFGLVGMASGQPVGQPPIRGGEPAGLVPVDPNTSDVSPLGLSFRQLRLDFRRPMDFDRVYRLRGADGRPKYARMSGGLTAVFPRSRYVQVNEQGDSVAVVPPDTRWIIGALTPASAPVMELVPAWNRVDRFADSGVLRAADLRVDRARWEPTAWNQGVAERPSMLTDETYRGRRVADLLAAALGSPGR